MSGDSSLHAASEFADAGILSPLTIGGTATVLQIQTDDTDAATARGPRLSMVLRWDQAERRLLMRAHDVRAAVALAALFLLAFSGLGVAESHAAKDKVTIKGTAYAFDNQDPIAGATIRVRGAPGVSATSRADGKYRLKVPDGAKLTPYVHADGYHGIFLQTFATHGRDLRRVNFQIPTEATYLALAALLDVELDANGDPLRCAIVTTASTVKVRNLSFPEFVAYGAHGVANATASTTPALPDPVYFNESVIPDPALAETSKDGGIIWTEVPRGKYKVSAEHPTKRFASFRATCRNGRVVNANPPWGLHQVKRG